MQHSALDENEVELFYSTRVLKAPPSTIVRSFFSCSAVTMEREGVGRPSCSVESPLWNTEFKDRDLHRFQVLGQAYDVFLQDGKLSASNPLFFVRELDQ
jgi:hypothetical protein